MNSATLLILASAVFMVVAMHDKKKGYFRPSEVGDPSALLTKAPLSRSHPPASATKSVAPQPGLEPTAATVDPSKFLTSALAVFRRETSAADGITSQQKTHSRVTLRIARGLVRDELPNGLVLDCGGWVVKSMNGELYAGDGRGMNPIYANLVVTHERLQFGRLMAADHGALKESVYPPDMWTPESYLYGMFLLEGYPGTSPGLGKGLKVVAAPSGNTMWRGISIPVYTATFTLSD